MKYVTREEEYVREKKKAAIQKKITIMIGNSFRFM